MTASQQPDAEHAPLTSPAAAGSGSTGHDKAVRAVMDALGCCRAPIDWLERTTGQQLAWVEAGSPASPDDYCFTHGGLWTDDACPSAMNAAVAVRAHDRAALAAGDPDVAEALGLNLDRRMLDDGMASQITDAEGVVRVKVKPNTVQRRFVTNWRA